MTNDKPCRRSVRLLIPDRPGTLAEVTAALAEREIDIVRLEVWPEGEERVYDDLTLEAPHPEPISGALRELRGRGYEVATLPDHWWLRDWASEVFDALDALDAAADRTAELDIILDAARRLANTSHALMVSRIPGGEPLGHRVDELARAFDPGWIRWKGHPHLIAEVETSILEGRTGPVELLEPVDAVHGLAVEVPGPTAASAVLAVVGVRPPFLGAETTRIERYGSVVGRLHPVEPILGVAGTEAVGAQ